MRASLVLAALAAIFIFIESATAATVEPISGEVLVNYGEGFKPVTGTASAYIEVSPGSQVMVRPGASALITYAANCSVRVPSGLWVVKGSSPCSEGTTSIDFTERMNQVAPPPEAPAFNPTPLIIGGLVVGGAVAAVVVSQSGDDDKPASP